VAVTFSGAWLKIFSPLPRVGFLAHAAELQTRLQSGGLAAAQIAETGRQLFNDRLDAVICGVFLLLVATILLDSIRVWVGILRGTREATVKEAPFVLSQLNPEEI
jgi:carbon starvation protein